MFYLDAVMGRPVTDTGERLYAPFSDCYVIEVVLK